MVLTVRIQRLVPLLWARRYSISYVGGATDIAEIGGESG